MSRSIRSDSTEYLGVSVTADHDITGDVIELSLDDGATWLATTSLGASYDEAASVWRWSARILVGPAAGRVLSAGVRSVLVRVQDSPEIPVLSAGALVVT